MVTIIAGSNRLDGYTKRVAEKYQQLMNAKGLENSLFTLEHLPAVTIDDAIYRKESHQLRDYAHSIFQLYKFHTSTDGSGAYTGVKQ